MRRLLLFAILLAGCASVPPIPRSFDCTAGASQTDQIIASNHRVRGCYVVVFNPETWGEMTASVLFAARLFSEDELDILPSINGASAQMSEPLAAKLASHPGVTVYECTRVGNATDALLISTLDSEMAGRAMPGSLNVPAVLGQQWVSEPFALSLCAVFESRLSPRQLTLEASPP